MFGRCPNMVKLTETPIILKRLKVWHEGFLPDVTAIWSSLFSCYLCSSMMGTAIKGLRLSQAVKTGCSILFVVLYLLTSFRIADLHRFTHDADHTVDHSPTEERNPCHQTLYHQVAKACKHKFHLTQDKSCSLCDAIVHPAHIFEPISENESVILPATDVFVALPSFIESVTYTSSDRGPPLA